jgi:hypothetical protein
MMMMMMTNDQWPLERTPTTSPSPQLRDMKLKGESQNIVNGYDSISHLYKTQLTLKTFLNYHSESQIRNKIK